MIGAETLEPTVATLAERKRSEAARRRAAADAATREHADYAREQGGRFVVFGSYVGGAMRFDSDLDILVDFPADRSVPTWLFAEDVAARHAVPLDIHDARTTKPASIERILSRGRVLS